MTTTVESKEPDFEIEEVDQIKRGYGMDEKSPGSWEPGSQRPDQKLAIYYDFAAKSCSGQAIYYDFVTKISQQPRYSEWGYQRPQGFFHAWFMGLLSDPTS